MTKKSKAKNVVNNDQHDYRVLRPIAWVGERVNRGTVIKMTDEQAKGLPEGYVVLVDNNTPVESTQTATQTESETESDNQPIEGSEIDI